MSEAELKDWQARQYPILQARVDELSRAYAVQGLALEELTVERDRYRYALDRITCEPPAHGADMLMIARDALKTRE